MPTNIRKYLFFVYIKTLDSNLVYIIILFFFFKTNLEQTYTYKCYQWFPNIHCCKFVKTGEYGEGSQEQVTPLPQPCTYVQSEKYWGKSGTAPPPNHVCIYVFFIMYFGLQDTITTSLPAALNRAGRIDKLFKIVLSCIV